MPESPVRQGRRFVLSEDQCLEADREFIQFYHRRICWMALENFRRAVADAAAVTACGGTTVNLFDGCLEGSFWQYDNNGLRLLQVRFYPNPS